MQKDELLPDVSESCPKLASRNTSISDTTFDKKELNENYNLSEEDQSEESKLFEKAEIPTFCMKGQRYEKIMRAADHQRAGKICTEPMHALPSWFGKSPPVDPFKDADMLEFADFCRQSIVHG